MTATVYVYRGCDTCRKALSWLRARGVPFREVPIRETPPTRDEIVRAWHALGGDSRKLCNTSGAAYRASGLKDRVRDLGAEELATRLAADGNLLKRPFLVRGDTVLVGFREAEWEQALR
jgi:arsenate reductase